MGSKSKRLGNSFEYEIRDLLREATGDNSFERVPSSGAYFGGANKVRADTARDDLVEIMSGDLICPAGWRWVVECKNQMDVPYHQLFLGDECKTIDDFLRQVSDDATTTGKEPLLFMKLRKSGWKLPTRIKNILKESNVKAPVAKSSTVGILVAERADYCFDIAGLNHIEYTGLLGDGVSATWYFFDAQNWIQHVNNRTAKKHID